jgi:hypothetical protein|tara:strand:+ start:6844 stop:8682 length:1839 start_codon:yes stop_codon:yes gene_type:complete
MVDSFLFPTGPRGRSATVQRRNLLLDATIRDFSGGWNVVDNDLNLDAKFSKILENMQRGVDGANEVRPGTLLFADTSEVLDEIIGVEYFSGYIVAVGKNGKICSIDSTGNVNEIWSDLWANNLVGNPSGWDATSFVSFAVFNGELYVCNGVNKPVLITPNMTATYVIDLADKSNANTPIARFVVAHGRFLVMAGSLTAGEEDRLFISATDVGGTWLGDSDPNDAVNIDLGSRVPSGSQTIKGLGRFRDKIMVMFEDAVLPGTLGVYDTDSNHEPTFDDAIENVGALSHRIIQTIGEDMIFGDVNGVSSVKRALFTGSVTSDRQSYLIDPEYHAAIEELKSTITIEDKVWSLWDSAASNYMLFIPNATNNSQITEYRCFVYKRNTKLKIESWHDWRNWKFTCGCRSSLKNIFLCDGTQVFQLGDPTDKNNTTFLDYMGDQEMFSDETSFGDYTGWTPVTSVADSGIPIKFIWELPWSDNNKRFLTKNSRYLNFDTTGDNKFTVDMFTDNTYYDRNDFGEDFEEDELKFDDSLGWDVNVLDPALTMQFEGGDAPGFGNDEFGEDFGGGRPTRLEKLYSWTSKYKLQKLRFSGDAVNPLKFISVSLAYLTGSPRR